MNACKQCIYCDKCSAEDKKDGRCEYFYSVYGDGELVVNEYEESLEERVAEYQDIIDELN